MAIQRMGELLSQMVPLSRHDVEEILQEQFTARTSTKKRFGEIALSMGLCRPEHVLKAWCGQLLDGPPRMVDLDREGVDTQALTFISAETAKQLHVVPLRIFGEILVVAISSDSIALAATQLPRRVEKQLRFALASPAAIERAITRHYPALPLAS